MLLTEADHGFPVQVVSLFCDDHDMKIEHKVTYWDPNKQATDGVGRPENLESGLNRLGEEGWSTVAVATSADGGYLVVLTRPSQSDADIQLVRLAAVHTVRQTLQGLVERAKDALGRPGRPKSVGP